MNATPVTNPVLDDMLAADAIRAAVEAAEAMSESDARATLRSMPPRQFWTKEDTAIAARALATLDKIAGVTARHHFPGVNRATKRAWKATQKKRLKDFKRKAAKEGMIVDGKRLGPAKVPEFQNVPRDHAPVMIADESHPIGAIGDFGAAAGGAQ